MSSAPTTSTKSAHRFSRAQNSSPVASAKRPTLSRRKCITWEDRGRAESDKGQSLTLRPENTAGVVRAYIEHKLWERGLNKLYYIGPQFRRERPQKGRYRQFYQIGAEVIGPASAGSESPGARRRNSRAAGHAARSARHQGLEAGAEFRRLPERPRSLQRSLAQGARTGRERKMCVDCQRRAVTNPLRVFDCKVPEDQPIIETLPRISHSLDEPCQQALRAGAGNSESGGRPVSHQTTAWCAASTTTRARRSNSPTARWGRRMRFSAAAATTAYPKRWVGRAAPGIGFAIGEDRLVLALQSPAEAVQLKPDVYIAPLGAGMNAEAAKLARELAPAGRRRRTWGRKLSA